MSIVLVFLVVCVTCCRAAFLFDLSWVRVLFGGVSFGYVYLTRLGSGEMVFPYCFGYIFILVYIVRRSWLYTLFVILIIIIRVDLYRERMFFL